MPDEPEPDAPAIPRGVRASYADWGWTVAWHGAPGAIVHRLTHASGGARYLKVARVGRYPSLSGEARRTRWARNHLPVPEVVDHGRDGAVEWMVTEALGGVDATRVDGRVDAPTLVRILARGLRDFHGAPVGDCPFDFRIDTALEHVRRRLEEGRIVPERDFHDDFAHLTAVAAVRELERTRPPDESLVVCHGDYCLPNVMIADGRAVGFVDLGELGVADRWWDLAVATWSLGWNLGPGHERLFLSEYGVEPDEELIRFYRLLYDLAS